VVRDIGHFARHQQWLAGQDQAGQPKQGQLKQGQPQRG
jgi:hypothetical protein